MKQPRSSDLARAIFASCRRRRKGEIEDDVIEDDVIGDDAIGDDVIGDDVIGDDAIGDDAIGDDVIGDDVSSFSRLNYTYSKDDVITYNGHSGAIWSRRNQDSVLCGMVFIPRHKATQAEIIEAFDPII